MTRYVVTAYNGGFKTTGVEIVATNQAHLKAKVKGLGYDRFTLNSQSPA